MARRWAFGWVLVLGLMVAVPAEARRLALVVGVAAQADQPAVPGAVAEAQLVGQALRDAGYEVTLLPDVSAAVLRAVLATLAAQADQAESVVFFYAGRIVRVEGENRLVPADARLSDPASARADTVPLAGVIAVLDAGPGPLVLLLDGARPLAAGAAPGIEAGLAPVDAPRGGFVALSAMPGALVHAAAGADSGRPGAFAAELAAGIARPGQSLSDLMVRLRAEVEVASIGRQLPWDQSALRAPYFFMPAVDAPAGQPEVTLSEADPFAGLEIDPSATVVTAAAAAAATQAPATPPPLTPLPATPPAVQGARPAALAPDALPRPAAQPPVPAAMPAASGAPVPGGPPAAHAPALPPMAFTQAPAAAPRPRTGTSPEAAAAALGAAAAAVAGRGPRVAPPQPPAPSADPPARMALDLPPPPAPPPVAAAPPPLPTPAMPAAPGVPADLAAAMQEELKRLGCYRQAVDGDWGPGSRRALARYYEAKGEPAPQALDPDAGLWRRLTAEADDLCPAPVAAPAPPPRASRPQRTQPAPAPAARQQPRPAAPAAPPARKKVECKFMVVAIVCK